LLLEWRDRREKRDGESAQGVGFADGMVKDGPALSAHFPFPTGISVDLSGNILIGDTSASAVRLRRARPGA
jgi:hypothetical protein